MILCLGGPPRKSSGVPHRVVRCALGARAAPTPRGAWGFEARWMGRGRRGS